MFSSKYALTCSRSTYTIGSISRVLRRYGVGRIISKVKQARLAYQVRLGRTVSIQEVADQLGVTRAYLSNIENGKAWPNEPTLTGLCNIYGISVGELLVYQEDERETRIAS
ncbi:helix-turn-helix domain-containing protein [Chloroflexia bacterium SDU3-3]|nr:helix-turn-helix domain-containing protein [Chloroflexia bacterium SDU3-3]